MDDSVGGKHAHADHRGMRLTARVPSKADKGRGEVRVFEQGPLDSVADSLFEGGRWTEGNALEAVAEGD